MLRCDILIITGGGEIMNENKRLQFLREEEKKRTLTEAEKAEKKQLEDAEKKETA